MNFEYPFECSNLQKNLNMDLTGDFFLKVSYQSTLRKFIDSRIFFNSWNSPASRQFYWNTFRSSKYFCVISNKKTKRVRQWKKRILICCLVLIVVLMGNLASSFCNALFELNFFPRIFIGWVGNRFANE